MQKMEFVFKSPELESIKSMGIPIEEGTFRTPPLEVIYEAPEFFLITPPEGFDTKNVIKAIRIRKESIDSVYYLIHGVK